ncbi:hypothetical protein BKA65DRAFT_478073 [Rhexocercosporidium sp. MPI-PUGE-AT-0058]|nr:hypothetical protein BKA65DRAFT_478073 [Rhexocercosporidium sp. MPI-PUGE-AT-0058]
MKFLSIVLLSLIGTSVAAPLNIRATSTNKAAASTAPKAPAKGASGASSGAAAKSSAPAAKASPSADASTPNSAGTPATVQGNSNAAAVMYAAGAFANDAMTVSASLNTLGTETDPEKIRQLATVAFQAESDEDQRRNVLATAAGSAGAKSNALIVKNTPAVLDGLMTIQNDPTPETAAAALPAIESARNPNILPSITQLSQSALDNAGVTSMTAVTFPLTVGSAGGAPATN